MNSAIVIGIQTVLDSKYYERTNRSLPWINIPTLNLGEIPKILQSELGESGKIFIADDYIDMAAIFTISKSLLQGAIYAELANTLLDNAHKATEEKIIPASKNWNSTHREFKPRHSAPPPGILLFAILANKRNDLKTFASMIEEYFQSPNNIFSNSKTKGDSILPEIIHAEIEKTIGIKIIKECNIFKIVDPYADSKAISAISRML
jgi:hypothetical protein